MNNSAKLTHPITPAVSRKHMKMHTSKVPPSNGNTAVRTIADAPAEPSSAWPENMTMLPPVPAVDPPAIRLSAPAVLPPPVYASMLPPGYPLPVEDPAKIETEPLRARSGGGKHTT